jgi:hypothetical protein
MGTMTLDEMKEELYLLCDSRDEVRFDDGSTGEARLTRFLNWSYLRVQLPSTFEHVERMTSAAITLATDDYEYAIDSTIWAIDHIRYNNREKRLNPMSISQLSNITRHDGPPNRFARFGTNLLLDTTPSSNENGHTLTVYGWMQPETLNTSSAASDLNTVWDEVIVIGAGWRAWRTFGDLARADVFREEYAALTNDNRSVLNMEGHIPGWRVEVGSRVEYNR